MKYKTVGFILLVFLALVLLANCGPAAPTLPNTGGGEAVPTEIPQVTATAPPQVGPDRALLYEQRLLSLDWPQKIRLGDSDVIHLSLEMDPNGTLTPTAQYAGHTIEGAPIQIPNLYDTHNLVAEARLDLADAAVSPQGVISEPLRPGQTLHYYWSVSPNQLGTKRGTLWLYLNLVPKAGGETERLPLISKPIEIESVSVLGLPADLARWGGRIGSFASFLLGLPWIESLLKKLFEKPPKDSSRNSNA